MQKDNELYLNNSIFPKEPVCLAVEAFSEICQMEIKQVGEYLMCSFFDCKEDVDLTKKEFENYLIGYMKQNGY